MRFGPAMAVAAMLFLRPDTAVGQSQTPSTSPDPAPSAPQYPVIRLGTLTYLQYDAETQNRDGFNAFDITRGYLDVSADVSPRVKFRLTPDARRVADGDLAGTLVFRLKYAYAQFDDVLGHSSRLRLGMHQTPWLDFEESINRYRMQGTMFAERELIPGSADVGVSYFTPLPRGYGEIDAGIYNGEGYAHSEINKAKSVQIRGTLRLFPGSSIANGLRVSGFFDAGSYSPGHSRSHGILMASFEHPHFVATAQWVDGSDRPNTAEATAHPRGMSVFSEVRRGPVGWAGVVRFDRFDPDLQTMNNSHRRSIAGVAYWLMWNRTRVGFLVDDESVRYDDAVHKPDENRVLFQTHIQF